MKEKDIRLKLKAFLTITLCAALLSGAVLLSTDKAAASSGDVYIETTSFTRGAATSDELLIGTGPNDTIKSIFADAATSNVFWTTRSMSSTTRPVLSIEVPAVNATAFKYAEIEVCNNKGDAVWEVGFYKNGANLNEDPVHTFQLRNTAIVSLNIKDFVDGAGYFNGFIIKVISSTASQQLFSRGIWLRESVEYDSDAYIDTTYFTAGAASTVNFRAQPNVGLNHLFPTAVPEGENLLESINNMVAGDVFSLMIPEVNADVFEYAQIEVSNNAGNTRWEMELYKNGANLSGDPVQTFTLYNKATISLKTISFANDNGGFNGFTFKITSSTGNNYKFYSRGMWLRLANVPTEDRYYETTEFAVGTGTTSGLGMGIGPNGDLSGIFEDAATANVMWTNGTANNLSTGSVLSILVPEINGKYFEFAEMEVFNWGFNWSVGFYKNSSDLNGEPIDTLTINGRIFLKLEVAKYVDSDGYFNGFTLKILSDEGSGQLYSRGINLTYNYSDEPEPLTLTNSYDGNTLTLGVDGGDVGYVYEFWVRTKIDVEDYIGIGGQILNTQYIWRLAQGFSQNAIADIVLSSNIADSLGRYNFIVRIKDGTELVGELYASYTDEDLGQIAINTITVNGANSTDGRFVAVEGESISIDVVTNLEGAVYSAYLGGGKEALDISTDTLVIDSSDLSIGWNKLRIKAEKDGTQDFVDIQILVYENYDAGQMPMITSFDGVTQGGIEGDGSTTFTMKLSYANSFDIATADFDNFTYKLYVEGFSQAIDGQLVENGDTYDVKFDVNFKSKNGIYRVEARVARANYAGIDDRVIVYYNKYARAATLNQTAPTYEPTVNNSVRITAENGDITDATGTLLYAFYREDASGWVLIKNYSEVNYFDWTPSYVGKYNIQARVKDSNAGSYEKTSSQIYTVKGEMLDDSLGLDIFDGISGVKVINNTLTSGSPYKLVANYGDGNESALYKYTLSSTKLSTIYLSNYSPSGELIFLPPAPGEYTLTVRAISLTSFGYQDVTYSVDITVEAEQDINF